MKSIAIVAVLFVAMGAYAQEAKAPKPKLDQEDRVAILEVQKDQLQVQVEANAIQEQMLQLQQRYQADAAKLNDLLVKVNKKAGKEWTLNVSTLEFQAVSEPKEGQK